MPGGSPTLLVSPLRDDLVFVVPECVWFSESTVALLCCQLYLENGQMALCPYLWSTETSFTVFSPSGLASDKPLDQDMQVWSRSLFYYLDARGTGPSSWELRVSVALEKRGVP